MLGLYFLRWGHSGAKNIRFLFQALHFDNPSCLQHKDNPIVNTRKSRFLTISIVRSRSRCLVITTITITTMVGAMVKTAMTIPATSPRPSSRFSTLKSSLILSIRWTVCKGYLLIISFQSGGWPRNRSHSEIRVRHCSEIMGWKIERRTGAWEWCWWAAAHVYSVSWFPEIPALMLFSGLLRFFRHFIYPTIHPSSYREAIYTHLLSWDRPHLVSPAK